MYLFDTYTPQCLLSKKTRSTKSRVPGTHVKPMLRCKHALMNNNKRRPLVSNSQPGSNDFTKAA